MVPYHCQTRVFAGVLDGSSNLHAWCLHCANREWEDHAMVGLLRSITIGGLWRGDLAHRVDGCLRKPFILQNTHLAEYSVSRLDPAAILTDYLFRKKTLRV